MSIVLIYVPEDKEAVFMSLLQSVPYITVEKSSKRMNARTDWRTLEGRYAGAGITFQTLALENEAEKERERKLYR